MFWNKKYDLIAIGDTVTDAFIKLEEAHVNAIVNTDTCEICMKFADKIPFESVEVCPAVGNSANAAVSSARLGLSTAIITNLGRDRDGEDAISQFKKEGIGTEFIESHAGFKTNYHYVLWYEKDRTILIKHENYPYKFPKIPPPKYIYLSSLGEKTLDFHKEIEKYLVDNGDVKLVFQPGTYQIRFGTDALSEIYKRTEIFFCNVEEAEKILKIQIEGEAGEKDGEKIKKLISGMHALGPKIVCITDGPKGAYASEGTNVWSMPLYPDIKEPYERTGAGDAFSSTFTAAIILGKSIEEALMWGPINSMAVVQEVGAQKGLLNQEKLLEYLKIAPEYYKPKKI